VLTCRLEQAVEEESRGESNLQAEGPNYNLSGKLTEYSNTYKVHCTLYASPVNFTCCYRAYAHDAMAAVLVFQNNETAAMCTKPVQWEFNLFLM